MDSSHKRIPRIDVHHHFFLDMELKGKINKDNSFKTPEENLPWTPEISLKAMDAHGIDFAILSEPPILARKTDRKKARDLNNYVSSGPCKDYPERFGFFATLPFLDDIQGVLDEIAYSLDELQACGVCMCSSNGAGGDAKYIGDDMYDPIWAELNRRKAVVFIHGGMVPSATPHPHPLLGIPAVQVPNETFKAAAHLVVTGRKRKYPDVKIILSHAGGSTVSLASRVAALSNYMGCELSREEILADFRSFYCDTALSSDKIGMAAIENFYGADKILFGSDFPAVSNSTISWFCNGLEEYCANDHNKLEAIAYRNARKLFPAPTRLDQYE